jgi:hypothetical protein
MKVSEADAEADGGEVWVKGDDGGDTGWIWWAAVNSARYTPDLVCWTGVLDGVDERLIKNQGYKFF